MSVSTDGNVTMSGGSIQTHYYFEEIRDASWCQVMQ